MTQEDKISILRLELLAVWEWAVTEQAPLRQQEIDSIKKVLRETR
jgi:hypothetical protein